MGDLKHVDHIGIAVESLEPIKRLFAEAFGLEPDFEEEVPDQKVRVVGFRLGQTALEYLEATGPDSPIARFIKKRGQGLHHICIKTTNLQQLLQRLKARGYQLIDEQPRTGAQGKQIAFIHPHSMGGVLVELSQDPDS